jgi:hypothetical protein
MAEQRMTYWAAEAEVDEDLEDVDLNLAIGSFGQTDLYEDGASQSQNHAPDNVTENPRPSQAPYRRDYYARYATADGATSFRPNPRRREEGVYGSILREISYQSTTPQFIVHFYQAVQENNLLKSRSHMKADGTV